MQGTRLNIEPHRITGPIQLLAVSLTSLILLAGLFLGASWTVAEPLWLPAMFGVTAVFLVLPVLILLGTFVYLLIRYRYLLLGDPHYAQYLERIEKKFAGFRSELVQTSLPAGDRLLTNHDVSPVEETLERRRIRAYKKNRGLFLIHEWRPSTDPKQEADIIIKLHQHGEGYLSEGVVESVEYQLGPMFPNQPFRKTDASNDFMLEVSAYGPMLCLARVNLKDNRSPIFLERYINF